MPEVVDIPSRWVGRRFAELAELQKDKALFIPWAELDEYPDPCHHARAIASVWGKRLGIRFRVRKGPAGMYVFRYGEA